MVIEQLGELNLQVLSLRTRSLVGVQEFLRFSGELEIMNLLRLGAHTSTLHFAGILGSTILLLLCFTTEGRKSRDI